MPETADSPQCSEIIQVYIPIEALMDWISDIANLPFFESFSKNACKIHQNSSISFTPSMKTNIDTKMDVSHNVKQ
jgi:hypothetical protein